MIRNVLILTLSVLAAASVALADETKDSKKLEKQAKEFDSEATKTGNAAVFQKMSDRLKIPVSTLESQKQSSGFGFGQLYIANALAAETGRSFDQISSDFRAGKGWGVIAKENNVKVGPIMSDLKRTRSEVAKERHEMARTERGSSETGRERGSAKSRGPGGKGRSSGKGRGH